MTSILILSLALVIIFLMASRSALRIDLEEAQEERDIYKATMYGCFDIIDNRSKTVSRLQELIAVSFDALNDIANQNFGDPQFELWARKRALDTWDLMIKKTQEEK